MYEEGEEPGLRSASFAPSRLRWLRWLFGVVTRMQAAGRHPGVGRRTWIPLRKLRFIQATLAAHQSIPVSRQRVILAVRRWEQ